MKNGVTMTKDKLSVVVRGMAEIGRREVLVGIPGTTTSRSKSQATNAALGYIHEFGAPGANIPARPFLIPGVKDAKDEIAKHLRKAAKASLQASQKQVSERELHAAGIVAMNSVQRAITNGEFVPLKASTLRRRRARGRTGEKPLIDTGQLRRSITYVVRTAGKKRG